MDGSEIEPDVILWATGYRPSIPCLEAGGIHLAENGEDLYLNMFSRDHPGLYVMGFFGTAGAAYPIVSRQARFSRRCSRRRRRTAPRCSAFEQLRAKPRALTGGMRYISSPRHAFYVQFEAYLKALEQVRTRVERAAH